MKLIKTTNRFKRDFPVGITLLNVVNDRYYYFDKTSNGCIACGIFWHQLETESFPVDSYSYVYDRETQQTFKL